MKFEMTITTLSDHGDYVVVEAQGKSASDADWRPYLKWQFAVPTYAGYRYAIGRKLKITVL